MKNGNKAARLRRSIRTGVVLAPLGVGIALGTTPLVQAQQATGAGQASSANATQQQPLDSIAAVVNGDAIMKSELDSRVAQVRSQVEQEAQSQGASAPSETDLERQVLDRLILEKIQLQMAKRADLKLSDDQLDQAIAQVAQRNHMTPSQFTHALTQQGLSIKQVRQQIGREILVSQVQQGSVGSQVRVTDAEINQFLEDRAAATGVQYHVQQLLVPLSSNASAEQVSQARQQIQAMRLKVMQGQDPSAVASQAAQQEPQAYADNAPEGSDLGWRGQNDLPTVFSSVVPNLALGAVSQPIRDSSGFHLVKLVERRGGDQKPVTVEQFKVRHILIAPNPIRNDAQAEQLAQQLDQKIKAGANFGDLAKQYSNDPGSALSGGEMGWVNEGDTVGPFNDFLEKARVGQISAPVKTRFGWHIIQLQDRRQQDATVDEERTQARRVLFQRKANDALQTWLQQIRSQAYVENRLFPDDTGNLQASPAAGQGAAQPQQ